MERTQRGGNSGVEQDHPIVDPTKNVLDLVEAANKRQDDLRLASKELADAKIAHQKELSDLCVTHQGVIGKLREEHQEKMAAAESGRLDSIRQVDREEVAKTAVAANTAITTLAKQTNDLAVTLAKTVADTAAAAEARNSAQYSDTNKRLSALELSSSEGKGKQTVADPMMAELVTEMKAMRQSQATGTGKSLGMAATVGILVTGLGVIGSLVMLAGVAITLILFLNRRPEPVPAAPPQIIYTPAPPGTQLPSSPPATVPR